MCLRSLHPNESYLSVTHEVIIPKIRCTMKPNPRSLAVGDLVGAFSLAFLILRLRLWLHLGWWRSKPMKLGEQSAKL